MSKKQFRSQASTARAAFGSGVSFGNSFGGSAFGASSPISWIAEPPDLSGISDPNVTVSFKNLSKKDSTTKAKALEDLQAYVSSTEDQQIEEAVLEAWVKVYPRLSIDSERRVRQLAQTLLGNIAVNCGKRIARHMPKIAGPWLGGAQDSDKAAAKAAQDALKKVFNTPAKLQNVEKAFQQPILEYCRDAVLNESVQTLSDERAVSVDDAEATYSRVMATSVAVIAKLSRDLSPEEIGKQQETYNALIAESKIWEFAAYKDVVVRRHVHRLLRACLAKQKTAVETNLSIISKSYIDKALHSDQTGSTYDLVEALVELTDAFPHAWTSSYKGKKTAGERLRQGLKKGSQAGTADFWISVGTLFTKLPADVLPKESAEVKKFLTSLRDGVNLRDERFNASAAWDTYFKVTNLILANSSFAQDESEAIVREMVLPVIEQYLRPSQETAEWSITGAKAAWIVSKAAVVQQVPSQLAREWPGYANGLIQEIKTSAPEQSKDFDKSQISVAQAGERWSLLQSELLRGNFDLPDELRNAFKAATQEILRESLQLLQTRNGKPYGAAAVVDELLHHCGDVIFGDQELHSIISAFVLGELPKLIFSPSQRQLFALLYRYQSNDKFTEAWSNVASSLASSPDTPEKLNAFRILLSSPGVKAVAEHASQSTEIQTFLQHQYQSSISSGEQWTFLASVLRTTPSVASIATSDSILADLTSSLSISDQAASALQGLEAISSGNRNVIKDFIGKPNGGELLPNLLHLQESPDDSISQRASNISKCIVGGTDKSSSQGILFDVIHQSLNNVSSGSLPIMSVLEMATDLLSEPKSDEQKKEVAKQALPNLDIWAKSLSPFLGRSPPPSQAITSLLGGAVYTIQSGGASREEKVSRDAEGFSQALRFVFYVTRVYANAQFLEALDSEAQATLFRLACITYTLMQDGVNLRGPQGLTTPHDGDFDVSLSRFQTEVGHFVSDCFFRYEDVSNISYSFVGSAIDSLLEDSKTSTSNAFYNAEALGFALAELHSAHGTSHGKVQEYEDNSLQFYKTREVLPFIASASGLAEALVSSKKLDRQTNELVADLTGLKAESISEKALRPLVMLNALLLNRQAGSVVAKQRLIFLMKHILPWLNASEIATEVKAETCKLLWVVLPAISDIYGEHWAQVLSFIVSTWSRGFVDVENETLDHSGMVLVHNSLRLYDTLRTLTVGEDPNDDLLDCWKESENSAHAELVSLLKGVPDLEYLPLNATSDLIAQELGRSQRADIENTEELYPLLYAASRSLRRTAFSILHTHIPTLQEQVSFDAALENKTAKLPDELLSLILKAPDLDDFDTAVREIPCDVQGYLYSWQLVFDHFSNASYKVKSDYIESLKEDKSLPDLLNLTYEVLGHNRGRPVDVSKYNITHYDYSEQEDRLSDTELTPQKRTQWLLAHLFYQCLTHLPSLTKEHYLTIKSRQTSQAVESWTAKYIAPIIINASLSSVAEWAATSAKDDPEFENLTVKVSMKSREVNVSYLVDEQTMAIVVRLPEDYPLSMSRVEGVNRVAVDERKWLSWLRNCQGVITFSNGNLIDGLSTWRKNVTGALKGQTECAICYSIISGDKQLPSKRCSTCKNLFHSSCLFKWFKSSNASSCPLCRNPFNYG